MSIIENRKWKEYITRQQTHYLGDEELNVRIIGDFWTVSQLLWKIIGKIRLVIIATYV
jgi:hypothetical protein